VGALRHVLAGEQVAAERKAAAAVDRRRLTRLLDALEDWGEAPRFTPVGGLALALVAPDLLLPTLGRVLLHPGWLIVNPPLPLRAGARPLHRLRRRIKALRYAVECLSDWYGEPTSGWLSELHAIQNALGNWHDDGLLLRRMEGIEGLDTSRAAALARVREWLRPWPGWRERYLDPGARAAMRRLLEAPPVRISAAMARGPST
jgi:CHAD domain-containing protein